LDYFEFRGRQRFFEADGGKIAYVDEGSGPVINLVHGFPTSSWLFRNLIPILVENGLRVIAPDLLGFGSSDKPEDPDLYTLKRQAGRIQALMRSLNISSWTQVCHDLGGPWTWEIIDAEPERIRKLIITNTTAYRDGWNPPATIDMMAGPVGAILLPLLGNKLLGPRLGKSMFDDFVGHPENLTQSDREGYWIPFPEGTTRTMRYFAQGFKTLADHFPRYQAALRNLDLPVMLVWGKSDQALDCEVMTGQFARDLNIPDERIHLFEDARHFLWEDYPQEIAHLMADFAK
jgi:pimeloyl-ACP methyl ester carboxylesterase